MKTRNSIIIIILIVLSSCRTQDIKYVPNYSITVVKPKSSKLTIDEVNVWQHKDILEDSIPGISLDKAYKELLRNKKGDTIIVAIVDTRLDINHEDLKDFIWSNEDEIKDNGIDDDANGYIDDVHGWNFLASKTGDNIISLNFSYTRFFGKYQHYFKNKSINQISKKELNKYKLFKKSEKKLTEEIDLIKENITYLDSLDNERVAIFNKLKHQFPNKITNKDFLDSLSLDNYDSITKQYIRKYKYHLKIKNIVSNQLKNQYNYLNIYLNYDYDESSIFKDDVNNLNDISYGNSDVSGDIENLYHSTQVTGVIVANRNNNKGVKGVTNIAKIMPVCISPAGSERDKDIALGIRYAVDNGAKIINITFTKQYPIKNNWVNEAIKYAAKKDVLIVSASGNDYMNLDIEDSYPNDSENKKYEFVNNFIKVGASWFKLNERLIPDFSNYSNNEVDIFAPGKYIHTTHPNNKYEHVDGTSFAAPLVSGVAALIFSYYPNLTASEVKQIIMESGVSYNIMVNKPSENEEKELVPFSSLSKSGKIVNAYNALLLAEKISKKKKRN